MPPPPPPRAGEREASSAAPTPRAPIGSSSCGDSAGLGVMETTAQGVVGAAGATPTRPAADDSTGAAGRAPIAAPPATTAVAQAPGAAPPTTATTLAHTPNAAGARHRSDPPLAPLPHPPPRAFRWHAPARTHTFATLRQFPSALRHVATDALRSHRSLPTSSASLTTGPTTRSPACTSSLGSRGTPTASRATRTYSAGASPMSTSARAAPATTFAGRPSSDAGAAASNGAPPTAPGSAVPARPSAHGTSLS